MLGVEISADRLLMSNRGSAMTNLKSGAVGEDHGLVGVGAMGGVTERLCLVGVS